jgi:hypothetical protein
VDIVLDIFTTTKCIRILVGKSDRKRSVGDLDSDGRRVALTVVRIVVGTSGGLWWKLYCSFAFQKWRGIY